MTDTVHRYDHTALPSTEQHERWRDRLQSDENAIDWLWRLVAPEMAERRRARTCALLTVASPLDRNDVRGRSHLLLYDDEVGGTGKSALGNYLKRVLPDGHGIGPDSSEAGLKYNANTGQVGKLGTCHGDVLRVEEFEKFPKGDRQATYEAMSDGEYEVNKGGVDATFPAEVRVIALSNEPSKLADPLVSRFDYRVEMDSYDEEETITVGQRLQTRFKERFIERRNDGPVVEPLVAYLHWTSNKDPKLPDDVHGEIQDGLEHLVGSADKNGEIRKKEGYMRGAYTISRLNRRDITFEDWMRAVDLIEPDVDVGAIFDHRPETQ
jgi:DNA replicative helicase MCM subunit Mcm2 (Cdc46/Mcm family)